MTKFEKIHRELCIILLNYFNDGDTIECVASVSRSEDIDLPFILIADNSDGISHIEVKLSFYPYMKVLVPPENLGFGNGINYALEWARNNITFDYLLVLNNDTILKTDTLSKLVHYARTHRSVALYAPCIITTDTPQRIWYAGGKMNLSRMTPVIRYIGKEFSGSCFSDSETDFASGCAMMVSPGLLDLMEKLFDPNIFIYDEDAELSIRLRKQGKVIAFVGNSVVVHKCQGSQKSGTSRVINQLSPHDANLLFYLRNTIKNRFYILDKHFKGTERIFIKASLVLYWCLKSIQFALHLRFNAFAAVIRELAVSVSWIKISKRLE